MKKKENKIIYKIELVAGSDYQKKFMTETLEIFLNALKSNSEFNHKNNKLKWEKEK